PRPGFGEHHEALVELHGLLARRQAEIVLDVRAEWERVAAVDRSLTGPQWAFVLTDLAGGLGGVAGVRFGSAWRTSALGALASAERHLERLASVERVPPASAAQHYDDLAFYGDEAKSARADAARGTQIIRNARLASAGLSGALAV